MEYKLKAKITRSKLSEGYVLNATHKYELVGSDSDNDIFANAKLYTEIDDDINEIVDNGQDDSFNSCKLLESGSLVQTESSGGGADMGITGTV